MNCPKKLEKLARALSVQRLLGIGFPTDRILDRVDESWMVYYEEASELNKIINHISDSDLDGEFSDEQLKKWGGEKE